MLSTLRRFEREFLPALMGDRSGWRSKCIDYSPPVVWRLYQDVLIDGVLYRAYLHRIFPCERAFFHPHPWASAVRVIPQPGAVYEMAVGFSPNDRHDPPPHAAVLRVEHGFEYEMTHQDAWHYVRIDGPEGVSSISVMLSAPPWERPGGAPRTSVRDFRELTAAEASPIFGAVADHYSLNDGG